MRRLLTLAVVATALLLPADVVAAWPRRPMPRTWLTATVARPNSTATVAV